MLPILTPFRGMFFFSGGKTYFFHADSLTYHKSTPSSYFRAPYNSSGALYHLQIEPRGDLLEPIYRTGLHCDNCE